ncbi:MAG: efflux RND transporter periplasmic adaptor subunit [Verrucomicrobia bacterium]|nr:efflux RND transporter periplasmic adaptor subunit [Verrucomicrobiota bacterium]
MKMNLRFSLPLLLGSTLFAGCHSGEKAAAPLGSTVQGEKISIPSDSPQLASLTVTPAETCNASKLLLNGRLVWDDNVTVRVFTPFGGRVAKILVESGQLVEKGAPLVAIASPDYGQAQADARKAVSDFALAERTLARVKELFDHGAAPQKDLQSAEADFARAQSEKQRTQARLVMYGGTDSASEDLYQLKSPLTGVVVEKNINPGQEVRADQMLANAPQLCAPLFVLTDPERLWIQLDANEADLPYLRHGLPFTLRARAYPDQEFHGKIEVVSDSLDPATRTIKVRGSVDNAARQLKAEMFVSVEIAGEAKPGLDVPAKAVFLKGEKHYLFVEQARGQFQRREIQTGPEHDGKILVRDGLQPGQRVVADGAMLLEQLYVSEGT